VPNVAISPKSTKHQSERRLCVAFIIPNKIGDEN
jgi:hypothetical protein